MQTNQETPEFDEYAHSYTQLLEDSMRKRFTQDPLYFHKRKWMLLEKLLLTVGRDPGTMKWLDVGCGQGDLLRLAGDRFAHAMGCDPSGGMLKSDSPLEMLRQISPPKYHARAHSLDFVTAVCVYHHVHGTDRELLTREIMRVLKPNGICCVIEHNPWNPVTRSIVKRCPVDVDAELISALAARLLFERSGFATLRTDYFLYFPERLYSHFSRSERFLQKLPLGGQYSLLVKAPAIATVWQPQASEVLRF